MYGNVFKRMDIRQLCSFILYRDENPSIGNLTYKERLKNSSSSICKRLRQVYKNEEEYESAIADLNEALIVYEEVFTELGMKSGARIVFQLLQDDCAESDSK